MTELGPVKLEVVVQEVVVWKFKSFRIRDSDMVHGLVVVFWGKPLNLDLIATPKQVDHTILCSKYSQATVY